jgi:polyisoprenoid-binding protein YceI
MKKSMLMPWLLMALVVNQLEAADLSIKKNESKIYAKVRATGHNFEATVIDFACDFRLMEDKVMPDLIEFSFDFKNLKTGIKARDKEMLHWLEYEKYPKLQFSLTEIKHVGGIDVMIGNLSFHNHSQSIHIPFSVSQNGQLVKVTGDTSLDYTDFKLELIKMLFFKVHPSLEIHFELNGELRTEKTADDQI